MNQERIMKLTSMPYDEYLKTPEWLAKRDQALERDGHRCRACNSEQNLNVHHRTYARRGNEDLNDLTTLCQPCHEHFHQKIRQIEMMIKTYVPPVDPEVRKKESIQKWEDHLVGLLIHDANLIPHVTVLLSEKDLAGVETRALFLLLANSNQQPDYVIPPSLMQSFERCRDVTKELVSKDFDVQVKTVVQIAIRLKKQRLMEENAMLKNLLVEAATTGDRESIRAIQQKTAAIQRQLMTINTVTRLGG